MTLTGLLILGSGFLLMAVASAPEITRRLRGVYYGWILVFVGGIILIISSVPVSFAMTVWAVALESHFGWSRTQLGFVLSLTRIEGSLSGPIAGYLTDRFGTRLMVSCGLLIVAGGFFLFSQVQNLWMFYLAFFIMSMGNGLGGGLPVMTMLNHWFVRQRSTAMARTMAGMAFGALVLVPAIAWAVDPDEDRLGWRLTAGVVGVVVVAAALLLPRFLRNRPQDYGMAPDGDRVDRSGPALQDLRATAASRPQRRENEQELTTRQALRTSAFWYITLGHVFGSMVIVAIFTHLGLLMVGDLGYSLQTAAWIVTVYTAVALLFQLVGGYAGDHMPKNIALFIFSFVQALAVLMLTFSSSLLQFYLFAILFGIGFGGRSPLTTSIRGEYFGRASFGRILGVSEVPMNALMLIAGPMTGYMRDVRGTYDEAFLTLASLNFLGALLFLMARKPRLPTTLPQPQAA